MTWAPLACRRPSSDGAAAAGWRPASAAWAAWLSLLIVLFVRPMRFSRIVPIMLLVLSSGCAWLTPPQTRALREAPPPDLAAPVELGEVPFFAQADYECGPAALVIAL